MFFQSSHVRTSKAWYWYESILVYWFILVWRAILVRCWVILVQPLEATNILVAHFRPKNRTFGPRGVNFDGRKCLFVIKIVTFCPRMAIAFPKISCSTCFRWKRITYYHFATPPNAILVYWFAQALFGCTCPILVSYWYWSLEIQDILVWDPAIASPYWYSVCQTDTKP